MSGHAVGLAAVAAAAVVRAAGTRLRCGVIAFAGDVMVLRDPRASSPSTQVVDDLLSLRGHGTTDLAGALRAASEQLEHVPRAGARRSCCPTACTPGVRIRWPPRGADCLHVLGTSPEQDAIAAGVALARRGNGRWLPASTLTELVPNLQAVLH